MIINLLVAVICCFLGVNYAQTTQDGTECVYVYGNWSDCINSVQTRTAKCLCNEVESDFNDCNITTPVLQQPCECKWKWSKWSKCTTECGGGNTTRTPMCFCNDELVGDDKCDVNYYFGRETVSCNEYECGDVPALNKLYWISIADVTSWPIENEEFNCSLGYDPADSPKGSTYYDVLSDPRPISHSNAAWYFLAKEWIAAKLNLANGVQFSLEGLKVIKEVGILLENCTGFEPEQIPQIYAFKEKLGRLNNNIGGLTNVDTQMSILLGGNPEPNTDDLANTRLTFILAIAVPLVAVLIVAVALGLTVYYVREKTSVAKDKFDSEDEDEVNLNAQNELPVDPIAQDAPNDSSDDGN